MSPYSISNFTRHFKYHTLQNLQAKTSKNLHAKLLNKTNQDRLGSSSTVTNLSDNVLSRRLRKGANEVNHFQRISAWPPRKKRLY